MRGTNERPGGRGFTVIELLVVIAVVSVLLSLVLPAMSVMRAQSRASKCLSNLRQVGLMTETVAASQRDLFPFWVPNMPASPRIGRLGMLDVFEEVRAGARCFVCPADEFGRDAGAEYSSYYYGPGAQIMRMLGRYSTPGAIQKVTAQFRSSNGVVFADRQKWHSEEKHHIVSLPDWHAEAWQR